MAAVVQVVRLISQQQPRSRDVSSILQGREQMTERFIAHLSVGVEQHNEFTPGLRYSSIRSGSEAPILVDSEHLDRQLPTRPLLLRHNSCNPLIR